MAAPSASPSRRKADATGRRTGIGPPHQGSRCHLRSDGEDGGSSPHHLGHRAADSRRNHRIYPLPRRPSLTGEPIDTKDWLPRTGKSRAFLSLTILVGSVLAARGTSRLAYHFVGAEPAGFFDPPR